MAQLLCLGFFWDSHLLDHVISLYNSYFPDNEKTAQTFLRAVLKLASPTGLRGS